ncbi:MAG: PLP-dependent transferase [Rhodothermales bacterium]|nr:PLP-dependent transferase [Rhodothermales bacterium]MBO6779357.1 PLP-dependent transferase [Rhodothermales bacterium]
MKTQTRLALAGQRTDSAYNCIVPPIYQSATFRFEDVGQTKGYDYTRSGNPTRAALEEALAQLDGGAGAVAVSTGMAAVSTTLALLPAGARVVCSHDCYGGTERLLTHLQDQGKLTVDYVDLGDEVARTSALTGKVDLVWIETPSNPLLRVTDLAAVCAAARRADALVAVDNTFLSPVFQRPIELGADLVAYSTTKYLNGHSDVVGGAIVAATDELNERIQFTANCLGTVAQPFDCWLVLRGLKTLPLRLSRHADNADRIARFLDRHPAVSHVYYPGLEAHPDHELAARQQDGFGGMVSFRLRGDVSTLLRGTRVFALAESLGGVESLIEHPATMSHASMRPEARAAAGITDDVIRLSVGIEAQEDLIADLDQALQVAALETPRRVAGLVA